MNLTKNNYDVKLIQDAEIRAEFKEYYIDEMGLEPSDDELTDYMIDFFGSDDNTYANVKPSDSPFSKIFGAVLILWFIASFIGMFYFFEKDPSIGLIIFGQYFLVFGLIALFSKVLMGLVFALVGLGIIVIPILIRHPEFLPLSVNWEFLGVFCFGFVFLLVGLVVSVGTIISNKKFKKRCNTSVLATIISEEKDVNSTKYPIYQYTFNKKTYKVKGDSAKVINVGEQVELMINPDKPREIYFNDSIFIYMLPALIGIPFIASGIFVMVMSFINFL